VIEGGLFPPDLIDEVVAGNGPGQDAASFGVKGSLSDEMQAAFSDIRTFWDAFQRRLGRQREGQDGRTSLTREALVAPVLERLDYQMTPLRRSLQVGQDGYFISHLAKASPEEPDAAAPPPNTAAGASTRRAPSACGGTTRRSAARRSTPPWARITAGATAS